MTSIPGKRPGESWKHQRPVLLAETGRCAFPDQTNHQAGDPTRVNHRATPAVLTSHSAQLQLAGFRRSSRSLSRFWLVSWVNGFSS